MHRQTKPLPELKLLINHCLQQEPGCQDCRLHAMCVHRPDHTGCNWSADVDFPERTEDEAVRNLHQARRVVMLVRERYNVAASA